MSLVLSLRSPAGPATRPAFRMEGADLVIGGSPEADWTLEDPHGRVGPRHCQIGLRDGQYLIADLGGPGTSVNGRRLDRPQRLADGDVLGVGPHEILVRLDPAAGVAPVAPPVQATVAPSPSAGPAAVLLTAAGLDRAQVGGSDAEVLAAAGALLRQLVGGLGQVLAARAKAQAELGVPAAPAAATPLSATQDDARALAALLGVKAAGALPADQAVAAVVGDLAAHQAAIQHAMQAAMAATLDRISPAAIEAQAGAATGGIGRVLPAAREAALWQAYRRAFDGAAAHSGDAFVETLTQELRQAYRVSSAPRPPS